MTEENKQNEQPAAGLSSKLEALTKKYGVVPPRATPQEEVARTFDHAATYKKDKDALKRISKAPAEKGKTGEETTKTGEIYAEVARIQLDLAELAETYGKLNVKFGSVIGKNKLYTIGDVFKIATYRMVGKKTAAKEVKINAAKRKGDSIEYLVNQMGEVLETQYQKAIEGGQKAMALQVENVGIMKELDQRLIDNLRKSYTGDADRAGAQAEVDKLEKELADIEQTLLSYEKDVLAAKQHGDLEKVNQLVGEMSQVLDMKHAVLDGRVSADGVVSEIRRQILDYAEGIQSAKGAIAASKVNYQAINGLTDSMKELEIKYKHALSDMLPVFKVQGKVAASGMEALQMRDTLLKVADISERLMDTNVKLVTHLTAQTFELLKTPLYDIEKAEKTEAEMKAYLKDLNQKKMEWAEAMQKIAPETIDPHYAQPQ